MTTASILFLICCILICLIGVLEDFGRTKKGAGWFTFIGCLLGLWFFIAVFTKYYEQSKQEIPIEQHIEQTVDTIPITLIITIQNEQS